MGLDEPGEVVEDPALLYALVKHVYPLPRCPMKQVPFSVELDFVPLGEDGPRLFGKEVVVEVVLVLGTGGEDSERGIGARGGRPQHVSEPLEQAIESAHRKRRVSLGEDLGRELAQAAHGHRADGHPYVVFDDGVLPGPVLFERDEVYAHLACGHLPEADGNGGVVEGTRFDDFFGDDLFSARLQTPQELVDRERALSEAVLDHFPLSSGEQTREPISGVRFSPFENAVAVLLFEDPLASPTRTFSHSSTPICSSSSSTGS